MTSPTSYLAPPDRYGAPGFLLRSYQPGDGARISEAVNASYEHLKTFLPWASAVLQSLLRWGFSEWPWVRCWRPVAAQPLDAGV